jgi:hypothetical protein
VIALQVQILKQETLLSTNQPFRFAVLLVFLGTTSLFSIGASGAAKDTADLSPVAAETLDVNLNSIYLKERTQAGSNLLNEIILQLPYPISETAKKTGQGPFGGITYFDDKTLLSNPLQLATVYGLGRLYYSTTVPGQTPQTFIPYFTFYRWMYLDYRNPAGYTVGGKMNSWLTPGFMYAYRTDSRLIMHADMELYSYQKPLNNRVRMGFSYLPKWPIILSTGYERVSWDLSNEINGANFFARGDSGELFAKIIIRNPPQGNFSLTLGYGTLHNAAVPGFPVQAVDKAGLYVGVEASAGVLAW